MGGRARAFTFETVVQTEIVGEIQPARQRQKPLSSRLSEDEKAAHEAFVGGLGDEAVWKRYAS